MVRYVELFDEVGSIETELEFKSRKVVEERRKLVFVILSKIG